MRLGENSFVALRKRVHMPILASYINQALRVDDGRVYAPLISVRVILVDGRALERPFDIQIGVELRDVVGAFRNGSANRVAEGAIGGCGIVIVLDDDREGVVVSIDSGSGIPAKSVGVHVVAAAVEV